MKVYHGTNKAFEKFDSNQIGKNTSDICSATSAGFFFTDDIEYARQYANYCANTLGGEATILECEIELDNPESFLTSDYEAWNGEELKEALLAENFDGAIIYNSFESGGQKEFLVLDESQIQITGIA